MAQNNGILLYLSRADVEAVGLPMAEAIAALEHMFHLKGMGKTEMPPKPGVHPRRDAFIHAMPAYMPDPEVVGMKWVSGFPHNVARGIPYISGLIVLNDPETGVPIAVIDCTWITAIRTAAATAVAAKMLARSDSSTLGIVACGVQGRSNLRALSEVFALKKVCAYDLRAEVTQTFAQQMSEELQIDITPVDSPEKAVRDLDLVVTSGPILKAPKPVIDAGWLAPGSFACPLDFDSYFTGAALREADILVTDDREQLDHYRREGYFSDTPRPHTDLASIAAGRAPGRTESAQRTIALNLGLALEDIACALPIYQRACERGLGTRLPL